MTHDVARIVVSVIFICQNPCEKETEKKQAFFRVCKYSTRKQTYVAWPEKQKQDRIISEFVKISLYLHIYIYMESMSKQSIQ